MIDLMMIVKFLLNTKLGIYFKEEFDDSKEIFEKLITFCSVEIKHKKFYKGQKIFNIGDLPDFFYIILQGRIDIVKPMEKKKNISGYQYFCYLIDLLKKGDNYTLNLCIENNKKNFIIEKEDLELLPYIFISINLEKISIDYPINFNEVLTIVSIPPIHFGLNEKQCIDNDYIRENIDKIKKKFPYKINNDLIEKYYFILDKYEKHEILFYDNVKFLSLEAQDYFGDSALDLKTTRNATIIATEDTDVGYLEIGLYNSYIGEEKGKLIKKQIIFLLKNFFFNKINPKKFQKKYFSYFIRCHYKKDDILYKENESPKYAYFIEEGMVELYTSKNIIDIQMTIEALKMKLDKVKKIIKFGQKKVDIYNKENNNEKKIESEDKKFLYNKVDSNFLDLMEHISKKEKNKVLILKKNEDLGIISFYFDYPYLTNAVVTSNKAKIFKIDTKYLGEIFSYEKKCLNVLNERVKYKLQLFQERFFNINNSKLLIVDKIEFHKKEEIIKRENIMKYNKKLQKHDIMFNKLDKEKNKNIINTDKFKELFKKIIDKKVDNNYNNSKNNIIKIELPSIKSEKFLIMHSNIRNSQIKSNNQKRELDWKNRTINNHKMINIQKLKNNFINKDNNNYKLFEFNNEMKKSIYRKKNKSFYDDGINAKVNYSNYKINNKLNSNGSKKKKYKFKNDSFILHFEKYLKNNVKETPLIFSKKFFKENDNSINKDKSKLNTDNKISDINKENSKLNLFSFQNKFVKSSRNCNNSIFSNKIYYLSSYKNKSNDNFTNTIILNKKCTYFNSETLITNNDITNKNIINSYADKKVIINKKNKNIKINHPYYSPTTLIKKEKYKVFTNNEIYRKNNKKEIKGKNSNQKFNELGFSFSIEIKNKSRYNNNSTNYK